MTRAGAPFASLRTPTSLTRGNRGEKAWSGPMYCRGERRVLNDALAHDERSAFAVANLDRGDARNLREAAADRGGTLVARHAGHIERDDALLRATREGGRGQALDLTQAPRPAG